MGNAPPGVIAFGVLCLIGALIAGIYAMCQSLKADGEPVWHEHTSRHETNHGDSPHDDQETHA